MYPRTPPVTHFSRSRLKQLATWIRDDLDILVAREGPDVLRSDDVLILHETFEALRQAHDITAMDLRATGIHKAVQDIAGVATRWPGRLCDDCDKIIYMWTVKFGPIRDLHPFLFGRGGRLEGIASITEYSREALLKRWGGTCPEKLHPKLSHRPGDLGFRAGAWWINSFFAHHAGIIGLESVEGGITCDKHGAYALVLKDTGEIEASSMERFTYRCSQNDKGRFRLTSATPRSRDPVRVLRSHSINSVWGPKAGIRYDGLYHVKAWSIKTAKSTDTISKEWKAGDIIYEVSFERSDPVSMMEVTRRPTATEVDDYSEYKRLRKVHRDGKRKGLTAVSSKTDLQLTTKATIPISPVKSMMPPSAAPKALRKGSPSTLHKSMFKRPHFDEKFHVHFPSGQDIVSSMTVSDSVMSKSRTLTVPAQPSVRRPHEGNDPAPSDPNARDSPANSNRSSTHTVASAHSILREVAPWIDFDADLILPDLGSTPMAIREEIVVQAPKESVKERDFVEPTHRHGNRGAPNSPDPFHAQGERGKSDDFKGMVPHLSPAISPKEDNRKSTFMGNRNAMAKLFDGVKDSVDDYFGKAVLGSRAASLSTDPTTPEPIEGQHWSPADETPCIHSPVPIKRLRSDSSSSPLRMARRDAICPANDFAAPFFSAPISKLDGMTTLLLPKGDNDPFLEIPPSPPLFSSLPISLKKLISQPAATTAVSSSTSMLARGHSEDRQSSEGSAATPCLSKTVQKVQDLNVKIAFKDPFRGSRAAKKSTERKSSSVAPDVVV